MAIYRNSESTSTATQEFNIDGDKGDITVTNGGDTWTIDAGVITTTKLGGDVTTAGKALLDDADAAAQRTTLGLGTAATTSSASYATATQGVKADSAVQPADIVNMLETSDIGVSVQAYSSVLTNTTASFTTADETKLDGIAAGAEVNVNADWNAVSGDALILNKPTLGTAAATNSTAYATAAQGTKADTALQPATIGSTVQAYSANLNEYSAVNPTAAGLALLDDVDASAQRTTLGLGTLATQSGTFSGTSSGTNTGDQNLFSTIAVSGQSNVVADATSDTLTLVAGANITITTDATTDTITIASSGGGGGGGGGVGDGDYGDITVSGAGTVWNIDAGVVTTTELGGDITTAGKALLDDVDASAQRATLGLVIGTDVQAYDVDTTKNDVVNTFSANQIISVTDNTNAALRVTQLGTGNALVVEDATNPDSSPFVIDANGNVGIGTSSPSFNLDISGNGQQTARVVTTDTSGVNIARFSARYTGGGGGATSQIDIRAGDGYTYVVNETNNPMLFGTNATERMRIDASGNVGINGTNNGNPKLQVWQGANGYGMEIMAATSGTNNGAANLRLLDSGNTVERLILSASTDTYSYIGAASILGLSAGGTERMRIRSTGAIAFNGATAYGTSGQVLQSNGDAPPTWVTASGMTYPSGSGIAVVSGGTSWGTTLAAPIGTIVGTTDTQTLSNKTISADVNFITNLAASSFVVTGATGTIDGGTAQKAIPAGVVVGTTDTQTLTNKTLTDPAIIGTIIEDVFTITDGAAFEINPGNGSIQLISLAANRTPKGTSFISGESVTLMVTSNANAVLWTDATFGTGGIKWVGGVAPTLISVGATVIQLWKVNTQVYGARVGDVV